MAFEGEMLSNLKARLTEFMEVIEKHDDRCIQAKTELMYAQDELEKHDLDLHNTSRRIELISVDYKDAQVQLAENEKKLKEIEESTDVIEKSCEELEEKESKLEEEVENMEKKVYEVQRANQESYLAQLERKKVVTVREVERLSEKANQLEERAAILEATLEKAGTALMEVEEKEGEALDKEELSAEKIEFLAQLLFETDNHAEAAERICMSVERSIIETENELNSWKKKIKDLQEEVMGMDMVKSIETQVDENEMKQYFEKVKHQKEEQAKEQIKQ